jgi:hypothetical protein
LDLAKGREEYIVEVKCSLTAFHPEKLLGFSNRTLPKLGSKCPSLGLPLKGIMNGVFNSLSALFSIRNLVGNVRLII